MPALAIDAAEAGERASGSPAPLRFADLALLALALPVFVLADLPLLGWAATAAGWTAARAMGLAADRRVARALAAGERRTAFGTLAFATMGRVWLVALVVLLVGLIAGDEEGLAAAVLAAAVVTVYLGATAISKLLAGEGQA